LDVWLDICRVHKCQFQATFTNGVEHVHCRMAECKGVKSSARPKSYKATTAIKKGNRVVAGASRLVIRSIVVQPTVPPYLALFNALASHEHVDLTLLSPTQPAERIQQ
jgi:hypothetical protein